MQTASCAFSNRPVSSTQVKSRGLSQQQIGNPQLAIGNALGPFQRAFAPSIIITDYEDPDKYKHLDQSKQSE